MDEREKAFESLFREEYSRLLGYAFDFLGDADSARDVVQELFSDLWRRQDRYRPENLRSYLFSAVRNRCVNVVRRSKMESEVLRRYRDESIRLMDADPAAHEEKIRRVENAISVMPEKVRGVLKHRYLHGMKYSEVAEAMGISVPMVHKYISNALATLRKKFGE